MAPVILLDTKGFCGYQGIGVESPKAVLARFGLTG
jgi:hypothetical protein